MIKKYAFYGLEAHTHQPFSIAPSLPTQSRDDVGQSTNPTKFNRKKTLKVATGVCSIWNSTTVQSILISGAALSSSCRHMKP